MIFKNEFLEEEKVRKRLVSVLEYERERHAIKNLGGSEGIKKTIAKLHESGLAPEEAKKMTTKEFKEYLKKIKS